MEEHSHAGMMQNARESKIEQARSKFVSPSLSSCRGSVLRGRTWTFSVGQASGIISQLVSPRFRRMELVNIVCPRPASSRIRAFRRAHL